MLHKTHYEVLGLTKKCSTKEIKDAYFTLSKKFHPDNKNGEASHKDFLEISEAYSILSKPDKRKDYDLELAQNIKSRPIHVRSRRPSRQRFEEEFVWRAREQSYHNYDYYYGIPGVKKVSNGVVAWICVLFTLICSGIQFYAIRSYDNVKK